MRENAQMTYIKTLYKFHKKEINTNIYIIFIGLGFIVFPLVCLGNITEPISVILVSIGCSIQATGITVLLSLLYKDSNNRFYEYIETIGLSDIFFEEDVREFFPQRIQDVQRMVYLSTDGCPLYIFKNNIEFWEQAIKNHVKIRVLYPTRVMEYKNNNEHSCFYNYQYRMFCDNWDAGEYINQ